MADDVVSDSEVEKARDRVEALRAEKQALEFQVAADARATENGYYLGVLNSEADTLQAQVDALKALAKPSQDTAPDRVEDQVPSPPGTNGAPSAPVPAPGATEKSAPAPDAK